MAAIVIVAASSSANITLHVTNRPAESVFAEIMKQCGSNFVYSSDLLKGLKVSVNAEDQPLNKVLDDMFYGSDITWKQKGNNIMLSRKVKKPVVNVIIS